MWLCAIALNSATLKQTRTVKQKIPTLVYLTRDDTWTEQCLIGIILSFFCNESHSMWATREPFSTLRE